jgi:hypothetical protein
VKIIFVNQAGGGGTVVTDGVTIQGNGSAGSPIALLNAETDGVTLQGAGISSSKLALKAVQTAARLTGAGTVASPLDVNGWPLAGYFPYGRFSNTPSVTANTLILWGFYLTAPVSFAHIIFSPVTGDGANNSDIGLYNSSGTLVANIGAQKITIAGPIAYATLQGSQIIYPGLYFAAVTSAGSTLAIWEDEQPQQPYFSTSFGTSAGGACPASITAPALTYGRGMISGFSLG